MRVALLHEYFPPHAPGGAEWSTLALAERLARRGVEVEVVTLDLATPETAAAVADFDRDLAGRGVRVSRLRFHRAMAGAPRVFPPYVLGNAWTERVLADRLAARLDRLRPDLLHAQGLGLLVPAWRYARDRVVPIVFTVRDYRPLCPVALCLHRHDLPPRRCDARRFRQCTADYLDAYGLRLSPAARLRYRLRRELEWRARGRHVAAFADLDAAVFVSEAARRIYAEQGLAARRTAVVHNLPPETIGVGDAGRARERHQLIGPVVLFVGRWSLGKGAAELATAWSEIRARRPDAQLVVVGYREAAADPGPGTIFTGPLPHDAVLDLMAAATVVALPSRWPEPYSRVALEAMAAGKPIVATRAGGNDELVADGATGRLVKRGDVPAFAAAVVEVLNDPTRGAAWGEAGRHRLENDLAADAQLDRLLALYDEVKGAGRPLRIAAPVTSLTEETTQGGGYFHVKNLQGLADRGVRCLIPLAFRLDFQPRANWDVRRVPIRRTFKLGALLSNAVFGKALLWLRWFRRERFDLVRVGDLYHLGPGGLAAARLLGRPTVGMVHHIDHDRRLENAVVGWTARRVTALMVPSRATADDVAATFGVDPLRIHIITEGATAVPTEASATEARATFGLADTDVVGFIGGLFARKNVGVLLDAFAAAAADRPRARLLVVGDGPLAGALRERATTLGVADRVVFTGRLFADRKALAVRAMDLFAFPSHNEGFGLAVAEAMAAGVPPIVSDRGSLPEIVDHERTGLIAAIGESGSFAAAIARLLDDAGLRRRLGDAAREHARAHFTWEACAAQSEGVLRHAIAERRRRRLGVMLNSGDSLAVMDREGQRGRFVDAYLRRYAAAWDTVHVFSYGDDRERPQPNTTFVPGRPRWKGPVYAALLPLLHRRILRRTDLLRVMQTGAALPALLAHILFGVPFVTTYGYRYGDFMRLKKRRLYGWYLDRLERVALPRAARVIVTTPALAAHVQTLVPADRVALIPNGVDLDAFRPASEPHPPRGKATVVFVGRLTAQKNLPLLVEAMAPLAERARLVLVGEGEARGDLLAAGTALGVDLHLAGVVPHADLPNLLRGARIFALPSLVEGHPKALVEAMACGLPCLGADAPGIRDVIESDANGLLLPPDAPAWTAAIRRVLDDADLARRLGEAARRTAIERYDLRALLDAEIALLRDVLEGR